MAGKKGETYEKRLGNCGLGSSRGKVPPGLGGKEEGEEKEEKEERPFKYSMKTVYVSLSFLSLPCDRFSLVKRPTTRYEDRSSRSHNRSNRRLSRPPSPFSSLPSFFLPLSKNLPRSESRTLCSTSPRRPKKGGRKGGKKKKHPTNIVQKFALHGKWRYVPVYFKFSTKFQICFFARVWIVFPSRFYSFSFAALSKPNFLEDEKLTTIVSLFVRDAIQKCKRGSSPF